VYAEPNIDKKYSSNGGTWLQDADYYAEYNYKNFTYRKDFLTVNETTSYWYLLHNQVLGLDLEDNPVTGDTMIIEYAVNGLVAALSLVAITYDPLTIPIAALGALLYLASLVSDRVLEADKVFDASNVVVNSYYNGNVVVDTYTFFDPIVIAYRDANFNGIYGTTEYSDVLYYTNDNGNYMHGTIYQRGEFVDLQEQ
jgi:hypothetical protein